MSTTSNVDDKINNLIERLEQVEEQNRCLEGELLRCQEDIMNFKKSKLEMNTRLEKHIKEFNRFKAELPKATQDPLQCGKSDIEKIDVKMEMETLSYKFSYLKGMVDTVTKKVDARSDKMDVISHKVDGTHNNLETLICDVDKNEEKVERLHRLFNRLYIFLQDKKDDARKEPTSQKLKTSDSCPGYPPSSCPYPNLKQQQKQVIYAPTQSPPSLLDHNEKEPTSQKLKTSDSYPGYGHSQQLDLKQQQKQVIYAPAQSPPSLLDHNEKKLTSQNLNMSTGYPGLPSDGYHQQPYLKQLQIQHNLEITSNPYAQSQIKKYLGSPGSYNGQHMVCKLRQHQILQKQQSELDQNVPKGISLPQPLFLQGAELEYPYQQATLCPYQTNATKNWGDSKQFQPQSAMPRKISYGYNATSSSHVNSSEDPDLMWDF